MEKMPIQKPEKKLKPYRDCHTTLNYVFSYEFPDHDPPPPSPCAGPVCYKEYAQSRAQLFVKGDLENLELNWGSGAQLSQQSN